MIQKRFTSIRLVRLMLCFLFLAGTVVHAQTAPKLKKDGKFKAKKNKVADHTHRVETKKKHHQVDWKHHNQAENQTFSKKKKKKAHK
jgi:Ni/Co efflux regulator RcnB